LYYFVSRKGEAAAQEGFPGLSGLPVAKKNPKNKTFARSLMNFL
jgi:hypothetical protein